MQLNKAALLAKIDEYYVETARNRASRIGNIQAIWDEWEAIQRDKRPVQNQALVEMMADLKDKTIPFTKYEIEERLSGTFYQKEPSYRSDHDQRMDKATGTTVWPTQRPKDASEEDILAGLRANGRFAPLKEILEQGIDDETVSISALQRLGILNSADARILWGARG